MIALILNSGMGKRMGDITSDKPKCMTQITENETILSRQLKILSECNIKKVVMTTGYYDQILIDYCNSLELPLEYTFVNNDLYDETNYIYSIYLARDYLKDDIISLHGDLVFEGDVLLQMLKKDKSFLTVSSTLPLPEKDFKAVIEYGKITKVGIEFFDNALAAQPLYVLKQNDWDIWLGKIVEFCEVGKVKCYAENALNEVSRMCEILPFDFKDMLCAEIDNKEDLEKIQNILNTRSFYE